MTDWIEILLGDVQEEQENEEWPALDAAAERLAPNGMVGQPVLDAAVEQSAADGAAAEQSALDGVTERPALDRAVERPVLGGLMERTAPDAAAEQPALDGAAELRAELSLPAPMSQPELDPAPEGRADRTADTLEAAYRPGAGKPAELFEPQKPAYRRTWSEKMEDHGVLPQALEAAVLGTGGEKFSAGAAGPAGRADAVKTDPGTAVQPPPGMAEPQQTGIRNRGLEELYRQTVQAARPAVPAVAPSESAVRVLEREAAGSPPSLTAEELDRAVRRDSRRYDGGMTIY